MRITNLHLIVSFLVLSGIGFFGYQFFGRGVHPPVAPVSPPVAPTADLSERLDEERARLETARRAAERALERAEIAVETARADGRNVSALDPLREDARRSLRDAQRMTEFERVESMAEDIARRALEAPPALVDTYVVRRGDTLWSIAKKSQVYGRGAGWVKIWRANERKIPDFDRIYSGVTLTIPREGR
jgi:nucleoid-associated protein YgaU